MKKGRLEERLLAWYQETRRDLPWRRTRDPYAIWLSEVMLQQTRVETVIPYYARFLSAYPTVHALAEAPLEDVLTLWSGLGYYRRARMLHAAARDVDQRRGGSLPTTAAELVGISGIGKYTAGAIASIAWGEAVPVVDGNVKRVLCRVFALDSDKGEAGDDDLWELARSLVASRDPSSWNQALMELGAMVCVPRHPRCGECPIESECKARSRGLTDLLPRIRQRKAPTLMPRVGFVLLSRGRVLLGRRPQGGLFGGMWEPPHESSDAILGLAEDLVLRTRGRVRRAGTVKHVLSHRRIEMTVYAGDTGAASTSRLRSQLPDYDKLRWVPRSEVEKRPLTSLAKKVLTKGLRGTP
jgi:A/G-specific adenine glycosylase